MFISKQRVKELEKEDAYTIEKLLELTRCVSKREDKLNALAKALGYEWVSEAKKAIKYTLLGNPYEDGAELVYSWKKIKK